MSTRDVSVYDIATKAKEALQENDRTQQQRKQSGAAQKCKQFINQRQKQWNLELQKYNMLKLRVLYDLLPETSDTEHNDTDDYTEARKILLRTMQKKVDKMKQSEKWTERSPKDHYYILNVDIVEVPYIA